MDGTDGGTYVAEALVLKLLGEAEKLPAREANKVVA
jgi:hypothetical protein